MFRLMKRKSEEQDRGSFLEYITETLWKVIKRISELLVKLIKRIIKEVWTNA
jgi:hypothetical protein